MTQLASDPQPIATLDLEIDSLPDKEFGTLYRLWNAHHLLGTFHENLDGEWVARTVNGNCRAYCQTKYQAQLVILAVAGLVTPIKGVDHD